MSLSDNSSTLAPDATPTPPVLASEAFVKLNVGGVEFVVLRDTLSESIFFQSLLSGRWDGNRLDDGSYFIDWDPKIFEHIIKYLRSGHLPTCFKSVNEGFDLEFVAELKEAAGYFGIEELHSWLENEKYLEAITLEHSFHLLDLLESGMPVTTKFSGNEIVHHHVTWVNKDVRICPREIYVHQQDPTKCGQLCAKAASNGARDKEKRAFPTVMVSSIKVLHKPGACQPAMD